VEIGQTAAEIWRFFYFSKIVAAAIFDFQILGILTVGRLKRIKLRHPAEFLRNRSNRSRHMAIFRFPNMAAAAKAVTRGTFGCLNTSEISGKNLTHKNVGTPKLHLAS